ncbi:hypothetical protein ACRRTK_000660 [Alexandromys fortis]
MRIWPSGGPAGPNRAGPGPAANARREGGAARRASGTASAAGAQALPSPMAQVQGEVDNMEGPPASNNNNNPAARWESPDRGWDREPPAAANTTAASLFECSRIKALAGTWKRGLAGRRNGKQREEAFVALVSLSAWESGSVPADWLCQ